MKTTDSDTVEILRLEGAGYSLSIAPATMALRDDLVTAAAAITVVTNEDESALAQFHVRKLAAFRLSVEKARTEVKKPVLEIGRRIDAAAADFVAEITAAETRAKKLIGDHAAEVLKAKRAAEAEERRKIDEARRAREEAERAAREADEAKKKVTEAKSITEVIAAKKKARDADAAAKAAAEDRNAANAEQMNASAIVATTRVNSGIRFEPDFEVIDANAMLKARPDLCEVVVKRRETIAWLKSLDLESEALVANCEKMGIKVTMKSVVSTR